VKDHHKYQLPSPHKPVHEKKRFRPFLFFDIFSI
jgi:hypothetical protein